MELESCDSLQISRPGYTIPPRTYPLLIIVYPAYKYVILTTYSPDDLDFWSFIS